MSIEIPPDVLAEAHRVAVLTIDSLKKYGLEPESTLKGTSTELKIIITYSAQYPNQKPNPMYVSIKMHPQKYYLRDYYRNPDVFSTVGEFYILRNLYVTDGKKTSWRPVQSERELDNALDDMLSYSVPEILKHRNSAYRQILVAEVSTRLLGGKGPDYFDYISDDDVYVFKNPDIQYTTEYGTSQSKTFLRDFSMEIKGTPSANPKTLEIKLTAPHENQKAVQTSSWKIEGPIIPSDWFFIVEQVVNDIGKNFYMPSRHGHLNWEPYDYVIDGIECLENGYYANEMALTGIKDRSS